MFDFNPKTRPLVSVLEISLPNLDATLALGARLGQSLPRGTVLLLQGDLGSGKTSFVQGLGAGLGITDAIVSPTFTLVNEYLEARLPLYHLDLYRLSPAEVADLHPEHYWQGLEFPLGIVALEWPERLWQMAEQQRSREDICPNSYLNLQFKQNDAGRVVILTATGEQTLVGLG